MGGGERTAPLEVGERLGEYRVCRRIGAGGMGVVYEAVHELLDRRVAIKVMAEQFASNEELAGRFLQEARAASSLRHPNIVDLFGFDRLPDGRFYQVMELLEGETLASIIRSRAPLPLPLVHVVLRGLLTALDFARGKGVIHRDIKPENIFVSGAHDGPPSRLRVKILDFGLAKQVGSDVRTVVRTRVGIPLGTPAYMSPEQCRATTDVDARTDIYAAGVLLYEMLCGRVPFAAESAVEIMTAQITSAPTPLSRLVEVHPAIEAVVLRALAKRPENRFQTAGEMLTAWDTAFERAGPARPSPASRQAPAEAPLRQSHRSISPITPAAGVTGQTRSWSLRGRPATWTSLVGGTAVLVLTIIGLIAPDRDLPTSSMAASMSIVPRRSAAVRPPAEAAAGQLESAEKLLERGLIDEAVEAADQARPHVAGDPRLGSRLQRLDRRIETSLLLKQARTQQQAGDLDKALQLAKQAFNENPDDPAVAKQIALIRQAQADAAPRTPPPARRQAPARRSRQAIPARR